MNCTAVDRGCKMTAGSTFIHLSAGQWIVKLHSPTGKRYRSNRSYPLNVELLL